MKLSVIIPCYNERHTVKEAIKRVRREPTPKEIILVDDGSTGGTRELIEGDLASQVDYVIYHEKNKGKGAAVIIQDADLEYDPADYGRVSCP